jgi:hypothetical protein
MKQLLFIILFLISSHCLAAEECVDPVTDLEAKQSEYSPMKAKKKTKTKEEIIAAKEEILAIKERDLQYQLHKQSIKERMEDYRRQGTLPPLPSSAITINGKKYPSYNYFLNTDEGQYWLSYQKARHTWEDQKSKIDAQYHEQLRKDAFKKIVEMEKLPWNERKRVETRKKMEAYMGCPGPWLREEPYQLRPKSTD